MPTYLPNGDGEHLFLWVEKCNVSAAELTTRLARQLSVSSRDIGIAGQKDRRAVTRQFVSVPRSCEQRLSAFADDQISILAVSAHGNKLRTGHLSGNRFRIVLRAPDEEMFAQHQCQLVSERLTVLAERGFPNYFGPQRFGFDGNTVRDGVAVLTGKGPMPRWKPQQRRRMKKLVASALQSAVFNLVLDERVQNATFANPESGDVVCRRDGIRPFLYDERGETPAGDLIPMGPMPGPKMQSATGLVLERETQAIGRLGLSVEDFQRTPKLTPGIRRRFVEYPNDVAATLTSDGAIQADFTLSAGSFATVLLAEIVELIC